MVDPVAAAAGSQTRYCSQREKVADLVDFAVVECYQMFRNLYCWAGWYYSECRIPKA